MPAPMDIHSFTMWLATGERGLSSEEIVSTLTGVRTNISRPGIEPADPGDFRRCELLLREVPAARAHLQHMRQVSPGWEGLVDAWDELVALGEEEVPGIFTRVRRMGRAPRLYARMREIRDGARTP